MYAYADNLKQPTAIELEQLAQSKKSHLQRAIKEYSVSPQFANGINNLIAAYPQVLKMYKDAEQAGELEAKINKLVQQYKVNPEFAAMINRIMFPPPPKKEPKTIVGKAIKKVTQPIGKFSNWALRNLKKTFLWIPRNAYLALVKLNYRGHATRWYRGRMTPQEAVKRGVTPAQYTKYTKAFNKFRSNWVNTIGGSGVALDNAILQGEDKKALLGMGGSGADGVQYFYPTGAEETAALIAQAAPIIGAAATIMKEFGIDKDDQAEPLGDIPSQEMQFEALKAAALADPDFPQANKKALQNEDWDFFGAGENSKFIVAGIVGVVMVISLVLIFKK